MVIRVSLSAHRRGVFLFRSRCSTACARANHSWAWTTFMRGPMCIACAAASGGAYPGRASAMPRSTTVRSASAASATLTTSAPLPASYAPPSLRAGSPHCALASSLALTPVLLSSRPAYSNTYLTHTYVHTQLRSLRAMHSRQRLLRQHGLLQDDTAHGFRRHCHMLRDRSLWLRHTKVTPCPSPHRGQARADESAAPATRPARAAANSPGPRIGAFAIDQTPWVHAALTI